jgi:ABC-type phosphate/phosphonate transport system substrate-binding protein
MRCRRALSLIFLMFATSALADFTLSAPPREDVAEAEKLYGPLAAELSKVIGTKVVFHAPASWAAYSHGMQEGKYDFVLDGPHFVAWRMAHKGHVPLMRVDGSLGYTVFTTSGGPASLNELRFKNVCSMASPNLAAVVLLAQFDSYTAPNLVAPRGGVKGSFAAFEQGKCVAVALPSYFSERLPQETVGRLKKLFTSPDMPNLALTVGPRVPAQHHGAIVDALSNANTLTHLKPLLNNLGGTLVPAKPAAYVGNEKLLEGVVWGW